MPNPIADVVVGYGPPGQAAADGESPCPSGVIVSEINRLNYRKHLLFVNKKKQKNFVNKGCP